MKKNKIELKNNYFVARDHNDILCLYNDPPIYVGGYWVSDKHCNDYIPLAESNRINKFNECKNRNIMQVKIIAGNAVNKVKYRHYPRILLLAKDDSIVLKGIVNTSKTLEANEGNATLEKDLIGFVVPKKIKRNQNG